MGHRSHQLSEAACTARLRRWRSRTKTVIGLAQSLGYPQTTAAEVQVLDSRCCEQHDQQILTRRGRRTFEPALARMQALGSERDASLDIDGWMRRQRRRPCNGHGRPLTPNQVSGRERPEGVRARISQRRRGNVALVARATRGEDPWGAMERTRRFPAGLEGTANALGCARTSWTRSRYAVGGRAGPQA